MIRSALLHAAAGAVSTVAYVAMTGDDPAYIMAMMALYLWVLTVMYWVIDWARERRTKHDLNRGSAPRKRAGRAS